MDKAGDEDCNKEDDCNDDDCNDNNDDDEDDEDKDKKAGEGVPVVLDVTARTAKRTKMTTKAKTSLGTRKLGSEDRKAGEAGEGRAEGNDTDDGDFAGLLESGKINVGFAIVCSSANRFVCCSLALFHCHSAFTLGQVCS
mmetsp:Transcript_24783/g.54127  ORF Transcript_24783/g.54127 Transcript_24783/m.54127 type:complete len:140 (+) Transcript_24783:1038-1457(+)